MTRTWEPESMMEAVLASIRDDIKPSAAARKFGLPERTVRRYVAETRKRLQNEAGGFVDDPLGTFKRILVISDTHAPYAHPQALSFLAAVKKKYTPDAVIHIGDELDYHAMSFHDSDPDLDSAGVELEKGRQWLWKLAELFPKVYVVESNHGSMKYRKAISHGVPRHLLLSYQDAIFGERDKDGSVIRTKGRGWTWHPNVILNTPHAQVMFIHQKRVRVDAGILDDRMCLVQGHYHPRAEISYVSTPNCLLWGMTVGCLIDKPSFAFAYNKHDTKRPIISIGMVIDGFPRLIPMPLNRAGEWTGMLP